LFTEIYFRRYVTDIRQTFYNVNLLSDLFLNAVVVGETILNF
jgi:hypothetical protein